MQNLPVRTEDFGIHNVLHCPRCNDIYLHHEAVEVYERHGEDGPSTRIALEGMTPLIDPPNAVRLGENPSDRRNGIRIVFSCEYCCRDLVAEGPDDYCAAEYCRQCPAALRLVVVQHKGNTFLEWEPPANKVTIGEESETA